jgi:hypothetical protein
VAEAPEGLSVVVVPSFRGATIRLCVRFFSLENQELDNTVIGVELSEMCTLQDLVDLVAAKIPFGRFAILDVHQSRIIEAFFEEDFAITALSILTCFGKSNFLFNCVHFFQVPETFREHPKLYHFVVEKRSSGIPFLGFDEHEIRRKFQQHMWRFQDVDDRRVALVRVPLYKSNGLSIR